MLVFQCLWSIHILKIKRRVFLKKFGQEQTVVVAKQDILDLELIDDSKVMLKTVPSKFLAPGHYKTIKDIQNTIALTPIMKGEQITKPRVAYPGEKTGLSRQVSVGKRAVALLVNENQAVGKLIKAWRSE